MPLIIPKALLFISAIFYLSPHTIGAQNEQYEAAYAVDREGKTVKGYARNLSNAALLSGATIKTSLEGEESIRITAAYYQKLVLETSEVTYLATTALLPSRDDRGILVETPVLGQLIYTDDRFDLLYLPLANVVQKFKNYPQPDHSFIVNDRLSGRSTKLVTKVQQVSSTLYRTDYHYRGVLRAIFKDYPDLELSDLAFDEKRMIDFFKSYAGRNASGIDADKSDKFQHHLLPTVGMTPRAVQSSEVRGQNFALGLTYSFRNKRKRVNYAFVGLEYLHVDLDDIPAEGETGNTSYYAFNFRLGLKRYLMTAQNGFRLAVAPGICNYIYREISREELVCRQISSSGSPFFTTVLKETKSTNIIGLVPNLNVLLEYHRFSLGLETEIPINPFSIFPSDQLNYFPAKIRLGYYLLQ